MNCCASSLKLSQFINNSTDFQDALPPEEMNSAEEQCRAADLVLCLGTRFVMLPSHNRCSFLFSFLLHYGYKHCHLPTNVTSLMINPPNSLPHYYIYHGGK